MAMTTHIALLRGVNVGNNALRMEHLREMLAGLGFGEVRTYLQSGNALFSAQGTPGSLAAAIERAVSEATRLPVSVVVRTPAQLKRLIAANPFLKESDGETKALHTALHVTFLPAAAPKAGIAALDKIRAGGDRWHVAGAEVYLFCPDGYARSKLNNAALERALGVRATTRNWNTVTALCAMAGA
jgi:uncharacterized protein (DUF1697 family)